MRCDQKVTEISEFRGHHKSGFFVPLMHYCCSGFGNKWFLETDVATMGKYFIACLYSFGTIVFVVKLEKLV